MTIVDLAPYLGSVIGGVLAYCWGHRDGWKKGFDDGFDRGWDRGHETGWTKHAKLTPFIVAALLRNDKAVAAVCRGDVAEAQSLIHDDVEILIQKEKERLQ